MAEMSFSTCCKSMSCAEAVMGTDLQLNREAVRGPLGRSTGQAYPSIRVRFDLTSRTRPRTKAGFPVPIQSRQRIEQRPRLFEIGRVEALGEPAVDRREKVAGFGVPLLIAVEPGKAHRSPQFPELSLLPLGDPQGFAIEFLSCLGMPLPQQQLAFVPV